MDWMRGQTCGICGKADGEVRQEYSTPTVSSETKDTDSDREGSKEDERDNDKDDEDKKDDNTSSSGTTAQLC